MARRHELCVLVANRGEIALRLLRGLRELGVRSVAVYSDADRAAPFVGYADRAEPLGPAPASESYLSIERVLAAGRRAGANAVHPGYGFLAESAAFAAAVDAAGWTFIGPTAGSIRMLGEKTAARRIAEDAGVPVLPSVALDASQSTAKVTEAARKIGFPLLIKATAGGGGKGMRLARDAAEIVEEIESARREAQTAFGDNRVYLERYVENARHVEVQILGDGRGGVVAAGDRDCTLQRRHQKLIEECPAPALPARTRKAISAAALALGRAGSYRSAGTVEFVLAPNGEFFFLEVNTRMQVEHPVTEMVHGIDILAAQIAIARGDEVPEIPIGRGHAIEVRVCAENPANDFLPSTGTICEVEWPAGPGVRVDSGIARGSEVTPYYDSLLAKICAWGETRARAIARLRGALASTFVAGVDTTIPFCLEVLARDDFRDMKIHTTYVAEKCRGWSPARDGDAWMRAAAAAARKLPAAAADGTRGRATPSPLWNSLPDWGRSS